MQKTTVYLPGDLKAELRRVASDRGRSEADLIREAIADRVRIAGRPRPRGGLFVGGDESLAERVEEALAGFGER